MINALYPSCLEFKKNEVDTLRYINGMAFFKKFPELATDIERSYHSYKGKDLKHNDFSFFSKFTLEVQKQSRNAIVGGLVRTDYNELSYFLAICGTGDNLNVIRKFHFDYAKPSISTNQPVPIFHMQYGGKLPDHIKSLKITDEHMEPWLSLPRLNFAPVNLALILDMMLCEFHTTETNAIRQNTHWRGLIKKNECFLTKGYYKAIADHMDSANYSTNKLIRDFTYGK